VWIDCLLLIAHRLFAMADSHGPVRALPARHVPIEEFSKE